MKKLLAALVSLVLVLSGTLPASAESWSFEPPNGTDYSKTSFFQISELYSIGQGSHVLRTDVINGRNTNTNYCHSIGTDPNCPEEIANTPNGSTNSELMASVVMGVCKTPTETFCIEDMRVYKAGEKPHSATFVREVNSTALLPNDKLNMPAGGSASLWDAPGVPHSAGATTYSAYIKIDMRNWGTGFRYQHFTAVISPYTEVAGNYRFKDASGFFVYGNRNHLNPIPEKCSWMEEGKCGLTEDFADGTKVGLTFRISKEMGGFFNGRLKDPDIQVEKFNAGSNLITVDGEPVKIPRLALAIPHDTAIAKLLKYDVGLGLGKTQAGFNPSQIESFREFANDTATAQTTSWQLASVFTRLTGCFNQPNQLVGLVTTNAMGYDSGAPQMLGGFLNYKVSGMHYLPDGKTKAQGSYDLLLRSDVARCLYGFSKAPISATISVAGGSDKNVATTLVRENNGWLKLAAYGFTFSNKTIKVKLTQQKIVKKTTITCVKGKVTKKVTAAGPKCPTGYKKK